MFIGIVEDFIIFLVEEFVIGQNFGLNYVLIADF